MKNFALFLFALLAASCKKEAPEPPAQTCSSCEVVLINATGHNVDVRIDGILRGSMYAWQAGVSYQITSGQSHRIQGDIISPYAHTDFDKSVTCNFNCDSKTFEIKQ